MCMIFCWERIHQSRQSHLHEERSSAFFLLRSEVQPRLCCDCCVTACRNLFFRRVSQHLFCTRKIVLPLASLDLYVFFAQPEDAAPCPLDMATCATGRSWSPLDFAATLVAQGHAPLFTCRGLHSPGNRGHHLCAGTGSEGVSSSSRTMGCC